MEVQKEQIRAFGKRVLVVGNNHHNTLGLVRSLGRGGYVVSCYIVDEKIQKSFVSKSKYIQDYKLFSSFDSLLNYLFEKKDEDTLIPILTTNDAAAEFLDSHYDELSKYYVLNNCGHKQGGISYWMNKEIMLSRAKECGLVVPWGIQLNSSIKDVPNNLQFPCILKPQKSSIAGKENFHICYNNKQLVDALNKVSCNSPKVLVQEYIDREYEVLIMGMRSSRDGTIILPGCLHKLRVCQHTKSLGMLAYAYTTDLIDNTIDTEAMKRFLESIDYDGIFSLEFMISKGKAYFLEINLRNDGTQFCFEGAGVNLPLLWVKASKGEDITRYKTRLDKKYCIVEINYIKNMDWHNPLIALREWKRANLFALVDLNDLRPAYYKVVYSLLK